MVLLGGEQDDRNSCLNPFLLTIRNTDLSFVDLKREISLINLVNATPPVSELIKVYSMR